MDFTSKFVYRHRLSLACPLLPPRVQGHPPNLISRSLLRSGRRRIFGPLETLGQLIRSLVVGSRKDFEAPTRAFEPRQTRNRGRRELRRRERRNAEVPLDRPAKSQIVDSQDDVKGAVVAAARSRTRAQCRFEIRSVAVGNADETLGAFGTAVRNRLVVGSVARQQIDFPVASELDEQVVRILLDDDDLLAEL